MESNQLDKCIQLVSNFTNTHTKGVVIIWGATATGKTSLSINLARNFGNVEIISADSRQIYSYMDIGTDKIDVSIRQEIPHHMMDIVNPDQVFTAGQRKEAVQKIIPEIHNRGNIPIIVGGTGLYIDTIYKNFSMPEVPPDPQWRDEMMKEEEKSPGYLYKKLQEVDPDEAMKHHPNSTRYLLRALEIFAKTGTPKSILAQELPVERPLMMVGLWREKEDTNRRINKRIKQMLEDGVLIQENKTLLNKGYTIEDVALNGIGYKEVIGYIQGEYEIDRCEELLKRNTHRYAKRQRSRFRRYLMDMKARPKEGVTYELITLE